MSTRALKLGILNDLLGYNLANASIATSRVFRQYVGIPFRIKKIEFTILALVECNEKITQRDLCAKLEVAPANLSVICERLVQRELLIKLRDSRP